MKKFHKQDDNWTSLGYSEHMPVSNYNYPIPDDDPPEPKRKPRWLIQAEEDRQLFEDWLQKKTGDGAQLPRPGGLGARQ